MMQKVDIVPVCKEHLAEIIEIEKMCFSDPWSMRMFTNEMKKEKSILLAAICDDKVAGYAVACSVFDEVNIDNIAVLPQFRRHGIAKTLLEELEKIVESFTAFITLEVRESNATALALYCSSGYECVGLRKRYYNNPTEGAVLMTKFLI